jgi:organic radical activating enzyme
LIEALHTAGFEVGIETNGTLPVPDGVDWICVSPKADAPLVLHRGDELKLVFPQPGAPPERYAALSFKNFFLQPMDSPTKDENVRAAIAYCLAHPQWRLSLQTHKLIGIP